MQKIKVFLRLATICDEHFLLEIRNKNRNFFFNQQKIDKVQHRNWLVNELQKKDSVLYIAVLHENRCFLPIGTISLININETKHEGTLGRLVLLEAYRHRGHGQQVLDDFKYLAKSLGLLSIKLETHVSNKSALVFYLKQNFIITSVHNQIVYMTCKI